MLELRARKNLRPCCARMRRDGFDPAGTAGGRHPGVDGEVVPLVQTARLTMYSRPTKAPPTVRTDLAEPIKALIEAELSFGYRTVAGLLEMNKNKVQRIHQWWSG